MFGDTSAYLWTDYDNSLFPVHQLVAIICNDIASFIIDCIVSIFIQEAIIGLDKSLPPVSRHSIIWNNAGLWFIAPLKTNLDNSNQNTFLNTKCKVVCKISHVV